MPVLRLFAAAREAAGEARLEVFGSTVGDVLETGRQRFGEPFTTVLADCSVWVNGKLAAESTVLKEHDVVAVLPALSRSKVAPAEPPVRPFAESAGTSLWAPSARAGVEMESSQAEEVPRRQPVEASAEDELLDSPAPLSEPAEGETPTEHDSKKRGAASREQTFSDPGGYPCLPETDARGLLDEDPFSSMKEEPETIQPPPSGPAPSASERPPDTEGQKDGMVESESQNLEEPAEIGSADAIESWLDETASDETASPSGRSSKRWWKRRRTS